MRNGAEARMKGYVGEALPGVWELHHGPQRDVPEVRHVWHYDGEQLRRCPDEFTC